MQVRAPRGPQELDLGALEALSALLLSSGRGVPSDLPPLCSVGSTPDPASSQGPLDWRHHTCHRLLRGKGQPGYKPLTPGGPAVDWTCLDPGSAEGLGWTLCRPRRCDGQLPAPMLVLNVPRWRTQREV